MSNKYRINGVRFSGLEVEFSDEQVYNDTDSVNGRPEEKQRVKIGICDDDEMGRMNGMELAGCIRESDEDVAIVFINGYDEYIGQEYEVAALHYLQRKGSPLSERIGHTW